MSNFQDIHDIVMKFCADDLYVISNLPGKYHCLSSKMCFFMVAIATGPPEMRITQKMHSKFLRWTILTVSMNIVSYKIMYSAFRKYKISKCYSYTSMRQLVKHISYEDTCMN